MADARIPKTCKAGVVFNEGMNFKVVVKEVPVPEPGPNEVLIKLNTTGLCGSDLHYMMNDLAMPKMSQFGVRSPGHEGAGVVVKIGANVRNFKVGDRAGIKPVWDTCGACELCWGDKETYCDSVKLTGLVTPGTYQQYVVSPARYTTPIPEGVSDEVAAPVMCSASTMYRSLVESQLRPGDWAVFPGGSGGVGIQGIQLAKAMGFRPIAVDSSDEKRELCLRLGAEAFFDFCETKDVPGEVVKTTDGKGAHAVFVTAPQAYKDAHAYLGTRVGAKIMCIGLPPPGTVLLGADPSAYVFRNFSISGTLVGSMRDTDKALDFARRGMLKPIYEKWPIDRLPEALEKLKEGKVAGRCVIDFNA
ncbi:alcohol dehydrogenase [Zopfia rhizophila CBS 207.26]|uniref:Alcohol dehydrogenase n=1 Tax=Zopfia rhizophila CBS 207.26 TaxID=1314779 RepID=A0A6A6DAI4_9PEZI|nr:alcohol dehydrogenase [Zopfia rhizophila CBS 207.26]